MLNRDKVISDSRTSPGQKLVDLDLKRSPDHGLGLKTVLVLVLVLEVVVFVLVSKAVVLVLSPLD